MKILKDKITDAYKNKLPFVVYNKSNNDKVFGLFQKNNQLHKITSNLNKTGFVFAPFTSNEPTILFPLEVSEVISTTFLKEPILLPDVNIKENELAKSKHKDLVKKGIEAISKNSFQKVVLSRKEEKAIEIINVFEMYQRLLQIYPNAFVYVWYHPAIGLWFGATPETLIKIENNYFKTMSLAGTQLFKENENVVWKQKELQEQQFVTDYIVEKLKEFTNNIQLSKTETVKAGSLLHLQTTIAAELDISKKNSLRSLINVLHPTPAVCGLPKKTAKQFILDNENYNRSYYTGYLGELNMCSGKSSTASNLFVNLRCMEIKDKKAEIYVGGGITKESDPEKEWIETVSKSKVMLKAL